MSFLIRKITKSKWKNSDNPEGNEELEISKLSADAITSCLRTSKNALSFWEISDVNDDSDLNNNSDLRNIVIALLTSSKAEDVNVLDIIYFEKDERIFSENGSIINKTDGDTIDDNLKSLHVDLCYLNHKNLTFIAETMCTCLNRKNYKRFTKADLKCILIEHIKQNEHLLPKLTLKLKEKLGLSPL